jgi:hypothetical protein
MTLRTPNALYTHPWTAAQDEHLRQMARNSHSLAEIARVLSRAPEDVAERLNLVNGSSRLAR